MSEFNKGNNTLSDGVNIDGVDTIVIIPSYTCVFEKTTSIKLETSLYTLLEILAMSNCSETTERQQIESSMKVVDPPLCQALAVGPRSVRCLTVDAETSRRDGVLQ